MGTHQEAVPSPPVALGTASCPLPGDPAHSPLLTWAGRGPRRGAGCKGWWPGPPQIGERRASGTAGPPGHLHTGLGVPSHSPEAEGKPQSVHTCILHTGLTKHPSTWLCGLHESPRQSVPKCSLLSESCSEQGKSSMCSAYTFAELQSHHQSYFISFPTHMQSGLASPVSTQRTALPESWVGKLYPAASY